MNRTYSRNSAASAEVFYYPCACAGLGKFLCLEYWILLCTCVGFPAILNPVADSGISSHKQIWNDCTV